MSIVVNDGGSNPVNVGRYAAKASTPGLVQALKVMLADGFTLYTRAHGFHWNVKGIEFSQYHDLFLQIYEDTYSGIDPTAENILKMGSDAPYRLPEFVSLRTIDDTTTVNNPLAMAADLLAANEQFCMTLNKVFAEATLADEQGVINFVAGRIDAHQKWSWQLRASLEKV